MSGELVLVTGGSGFVGAHCIVQLLNAGYRVRTTVRSLERETEVRSMVEVGGAQPDARLTFFEADLIDDEGWAEAITGCDYVLHVASPFPIAQPRNADELIVPAREGALRVLKFARDAGVKRVVLTSSFAAIGYGHPSQAEPFTEDDWTDVNALGVRPYVKSKALAERAAWDFIEQEGGSLELAVINPTAIFGPALGPDYSSSLEIIQQSLDGTSTSVPNLTFGIVDVRDVADLHLRAMTDPAAKGERFIAVAGMMTLPEIALLLKSNLGEAAINVPMRTLPNWSLQVMGVFSRQARALAQDVGKVRKATGAKARRVLGWTPRSKEDAILATAESLIRLGLIDGVDEMPLQLSAETNWDDEETEDSAE